MTKLMVASAFAALLAGCAAMPENESPTYRLGFDDGCTTASAEGRIPKTPQRNELLYARDPDYRSGWGAGHSFCRMDMDRSRTPF